jgi:ribosomal-protein-alanine N-acetyltransferase
MLKSKSHLESGTGAMVCLIRPMKQKDIHQVAEIDREAFPSDWSSFSFMSYSQELGNPLAHYIVACTQEGARTRARDNTSKRRLSTFRDFLSHKPSHSEPQAAADEEYIVGFAGLRVILEEAHLVSIATRDEYRGRGIGERLLISVIELATQLKASTITLEARVSNKVAQSLYRKYGFREVGIRHAYYSDDGEDAVLMSADTIALPSFQSTLQQLKRAHSRKWNHQFLNTG